MSAARERWRAKYGPWAVVTGASDGIGREMAHCLGRAGLNVMLVARRRALLDEIAARIAGDDGVETRVVAADLSRAHEVERIIATAAELDVGLLAACAGFGTSGPLIDAPLEPELEMIDVNCRAVLALTHAFGRRFAAQGRGGLVLMSSLVAFQGVPHAANYAATKAYVQTLAEALRSWRRAASTWWPRRRARSTAASRPAPTCRWAWRRSPTRWRRRRWTRSAARPRCGPAGWRSFSKARWRHCRAAPGYA